MHTPARIALSLLLTATIVAGCATAASFREDTPARLSLIGEGWARSSINAVIFRQSSLVTHGEEQFAAFYDAEGRMVLAKRARGTDAWQTSVTRYRGNVRDAHNAISLGIDGDGFLHVSWDHHGQPLNYARGVAAGSLALGPPTPQTGRLESQVTYPGFYPLPDGDLLFLYRDGASGDGDVLINRYDVRSGRWEPVQHPLIDGEGERNAYFNQLAIDRNGGWHLSWTWRESPDVASNHDIVYAYSGDEGRSWQRSTGEVYELPITQATGEVAWGVPQGSELINQTSMTVDARGRPVVATYWRAEGEEVPQFRLVWRDDDGWRMRQIGERATPFRLSGGGTKRIPVSRPLVVAGGNGEVHVVFRDEERGGGISVATSRGAGRDDWSVREIWSESVGQWEPSHDAIAWSRYGTLHLFHQVVGQGDGETLEDLPPQPVGVLEVGS
jgi:hypothetical protein